MADISRPLRLGTRGSQLAQWQARWVAERLEASGCQVELVFLQTSGDVIPGPLDQAGATGLFTKELQRSLRQGEIDLAVHSYKDLPTAGTDGLEVAAVPVRASALDVLVSRDGASLEALPEGARVGTSSNRRKAQMLFARKDLNIATIRGNVDTRLRKLDAGQYDAIVLAAAGLERLDLTARISQRLPIELCMPAPAQGALAIEVRRDEEPTRQWVVALSDPSVEATTTAERSFLAAIEAGCASPAGALCQFANPSELSLTAVVLDQAGSKRLEASVSGRPEAAAGLGRRAAQQLLDQGAAGLL